MARSPAQIAHAARLAEANRARAQAKRQATDSSPTDEELGIGVEDADAPADAIASMLANPALQSLIDAAVTARLAQMGAPAGQTTVSNEAFAQLAATLGRMIEVNAIQQPGYIKPLSADEVDRRTAGLVEMQALLERYEAEGTPPEYYVGEGGFFECTNALEFKEGQPVAMYLPPPEDFKPINKPARKVMAAMMQWIGGPTPEIGEQLKQAQIAAKAPPVLGAKNVAKPLVQVLDIPEKSEKAADKRRQMGTLVPEVREISMAQRAGEPTGPTFVGGEA